MHCPRPLGEGRDAFNFYAGPECEAICAERAPSRIPAREKCAVYLVEGCPLRDVSEHHRALYDVAHRIAVCLKRCLDVLHGLAGFLFDASWHQFESAG